MTWIYPHFTEKEMACRCGCKGLPTARFMEKLEGVRETVAFPMIVTSGYRCPAYNNEVSGSGFEGPHTLGEAADIQVFGAHALRLIEAGLQWGMTGFGVGQDEKLKRTARYLHLDCVKSSAKYPRPWLWSY